MLKSNCELGPPMQHESRNFGHQPEVKMSALNHGKERGVTSHLICLPGS
jgi:hypothetical protein